MTLKPCRDCGGMVPSTARGCPTCARNLEAERMLQKYFWTAITGLVLILAVIFMYLLVFMNR